MHCKKCDFMLPYKPQVKGVIENGCPWGGKEHGKLIDNASDILKLNKYPGLIKEYRPSQLEMAETIEDALIEPKSTLYLEGETGVGKSLAYLIPSALAGKRVVIATAKKPLQDQLLTEFNKITKTTNMDLKYGVYKGKRNYACIQCADSIKDIKERSKFKTWVNQKYSSNRYAEVTDWAGNEPRWWSDITVKNCPIEQECPHYYVCQPHPQDLDFVITNHTLVAIDLFKTFNSLLKNYPILIIDEAHEVGNRFRNALTTELEIKTLASLRKRFKYDGDLHYTINHYGGIDIENVETSLNTLATRFHTAHERLFILTDLGTKKSRPGKAGDQATIEDISSCFTDFQIMTGLLETLNDQFSTLIGKLRTDFKNKMFLDTKDYHTAMIGRVRRNIRQINRINTFLMDIMDDTTNTVQAGKPSNYLKIVYDKGIKKSPIQIADACNSVVSQYVDHKIFTSATLAPGGTFKHIMKDLGLKGEDEHLKLGVYPSPFSKNQSRLYIPLEIPRPVTKLEDKEAYNTWVDALVHHITKLIVLTNGKAFVLFTSYDILTDTYNRMDKKALSQAGISIYPQTRKATPQQLISQYDAHPKGVIFGTKSFWEGIDMPGKKLRNVIITKLPFPPSNDPLTAALIKIARKELLGIEKRKKGISFDEKKENDSPKWGSLAYLEVALPIMLCELKQGLGRLIRTKDDKGILTILDVRARLGAKKLTSDQISKGKTRRKMYREGYVKMREHGPRSRDLDTELWRRDPKLAKERAMLGAYYWGYALQIKDSHNYEVVNSFTNLAEFVKENSIDCN